MSDIDRLGLIPLGRECLRDGLPGLKRNVSLLGHPSHQHANSLFLRVILHPFDPLKTRRSRRDGEARLTVNLEQAPL